MEPIPSIWATPAFTGGKLMELKHGFYRINTMDNVATALIDVPAGEAGRIGRQ